MRVKVDLSADGKRATVYFSYSPSAVAAIKEVPGAKFVEPKIGRAAHWTIPLDLTSAQRLREAFGEALELSDAIRQWGTKQVRAQRRLRVVAAADDAELANVPPAASAWLRPYQRADVKIMSMANVLNMNQPGVGKTVEVIYAVQEAGLPGPHLVIAPITLHKDPWRNELASHAPAGTRILFGSTPEERREAIFSCWDFVQRGLASHDWLILNPDIVRVSKVWAEDEVPPGVTILSHDHKGNAYVPRDDSSELLFRIKWGSLTVDEFHKMGLGEDRNTLFSRAMFSLGANARRRFLTSGTPIGGKPIRLWGVLHFIEPELYSSKWRWAEQWLEIDDNFHGKKIGDFQKGREQAFAEAHSRHIINRSRKSALPGLPDKVIINVACEMTAKQRKAYDDFIVLAEANLDGGRVISTGVLGEFTRLKQFANALCRVDSKGNVVPTQESGKIPALIERLDGFGLRGRAPEPHARAIVASESARFVELLEKVLGAERLNVRRLDGSVTGTARDQVIDWYKELDPEARILVMTTQTGGIGLNLGMTGSIHIMDETWNPDDQEQLEDRGMRDRTTPLIVLYYRSEDSIQEYIAEIGAGKRLNNAELSQIRERIQKSRTP